jgi:transposase InsO family protein
MKAYSSEFSVERMACVLGVSRSGYYTWLRRSPSERRRQRQLFDLEVKAASVSGKGHYGRVRIHDELALHGRNASPKRIVASMKRQGIESKPKRRFKVTTNSKHTEPVAPNLLNRRFDVESPNQAWVSDITYLPSQTGWLYLTVFIDLFSRMVVGWYVSTSLSHEGVLKAFYQAIWRRRPSAGLLIHSDRGVQYACDAFRLALAAQACIQSMSRKGNCWDNAVSESFFATLKNEWLSETCLYDRDHAEHELFEYIERFYNGQRIHTTLHMAPNEFETRRLVKCA